MGDECTRWTIVIDKLTDIKVRTRLAERGMKKGDLSRFVEDAVKRQLFAHSWADFGARFDDLSEAERLALADEAVSWARQR